jgi:hypothetical protein
MEDKLREVIRNIVREMMTQDELEEITTSSSVATPSVPFAFKKTDGTDEDDENDDEFVARINQSTGFKKVNENRWHDLRKSDGSPRQKVGRGVSQVNKQLSEIETFLRWYGKIKKEGDLKSDQYWKRTQKNLLKIRERLTKIQNRISELS